MAFKYIILAALIALVNAGALAPVARLDATYDHNPQYTYAYDVADPNTGDFKSQHETRNGDVVSGSYSLIDSDGTRRTVDYSADSINGFNAVVRKDAAVVGAPAVIAAPAPEVIASPAVVDASAVIGEAPEIIAARRAFVPSARLGYAAPSARFAYAAPAARFAYSAAPVAYAAHSTPLAYAGHSAHTLAYAAQPFGYNYPAFARQW